MSALPDVYKRQVDALYRRVTAVRSRNEVNYLEKIESGAFVLNLRSRTLKKDGQPVELTQVEFHIMEYFFTNPVSYTHRPPRGGTIGS